VALNLSDGPVELPLVAGARIGRARSGRVLGGAVLIGTDRGRDGARVEGGLELAQWEGVVLEVAA
jgi:hypothetical protein